MLQFKDTVAMLLERGNAMQQFWGFYISVSVGLLAFFGSSRRKPTIAIILSFAFIAFAWVNCSGMYDIAQQRQLFYGRLIEASANDPSPMKLSDEQIARNIHGAIELAKISTPPSPGAVRNFHLLADLLVLAAIAFLTFGPRSETEEAKKLKAIAEFAKAP